MANQGHPGNTYNAEHDTNQAQVTLSKIKLMYIDHHNVDNQLEYSLPTVSTFNVNVPTTDIIRIFFLFHVKYFGTLKLVNVQNLHIIYTPST